MKLVLDVLEAREIINQQTVAQQKEAREKFETALSAAILNALYIECILESHKMHKALAEKVIRDYYELSSLCLVATGHKLLALKEKYPMIEHIQYNDDALVNLGWYDECEPLLYELGVY
nr:MAG TPA: hypothetical protein [Caudoviricetes sp.]